jgi:hypothetical protein
MTKHNTDDQKIDGVAEQAPKGQMSADEKNKILQEYFKQIPVVAPSEQDKGKINEAIQQLESLKQEVDDKRHATLEKLATIKSKTELLRASGKVTIDDRELLKSTTSVDRFSQVLDKMQLEVEDDIAFYASLLSAKLPETVHVLKFESDDFGVYLNKRLSTVKRYVKTAKRDLSISYSRYSYGFDAQINHLAYIEQAIKNIPDKK